MQSTQLDPKLALMISSALLNVGVSSQHVEIASVIISNFAYRLIEINRVRNFFSRKLTEQEFIEDHILDGIYAAAALPPFTNQRSTIIDLGSGPGLPGIILAAIFPTSLVIMIERREVPSAFVKEFILDRGLKNAKVITSDLRSIRALEFESNCSTWNNELCIGQQGSQPNGGPQRIFVSRAYSPLSELFDGASTIMRPKEQLFFISGANSRILSGLPSNFKNYTELGYYAARPERILYSFTYRS